MINVHVLDINNPLRAKIEAECEARAIAYEELEGGKDPIVGNRWDPWNVMGVPWSFYNYYKELGWSDDDIKQHCKNIENADEWHETIAFKKYRKRLENAVWNL